MYKEDQEKAAKEKPKTEETTGAKKAKGKPASKSKNKKDSDVMDADFEDVTEKKDDTDDDDKKEKSA